MMLQACSKGSLLAFASVRCGPRYLSHIKLYTKIFIPANLRTDHFGDQPACCRRLFKNSLLTNISMAIRTIYSRASGAMTRIRHRR